MTSHDAHRVNLFVSNEQQTSVSRYRDFVSLLLPCFLHDSFHQIDLILYPCILFLFQAFRSSGSSGTLKAGMIVIMICQTLGTYASILLQGTMKPAVYSFWELSSRLFFWALCSLLFFWALCSLLFFWALCSLLFFRALCSLLTPLSGYYATYYLFV